MLSSQVNGGPPHGAWDCQTVIPPGQTTKTTILTLHFDCKARENFLKEHVCWHIPETTSFMYVGADYYKDGQYIGDQKAWSAILHLVTSS